MIQLSSIRKGIAKNETIHPSIDVGIGIVMMLGLSGVGYATAEADRSITVTENWTFDAGFYPVLSPSNSTNYAIPY